MNAGLLYKPLQVVNCVIRNLIRTGETFECSVEVLCLLQYFEGLYFATVHKSASEVSDSVNAWKAGNAAEVSRSSLAAIDCASMNRLLLPVPVSKNTGCLMAVA